jgi:hypothetical protein
MGCFQSQTVPDYMSGTAAVFAKHRSLARLCKKYTVMQNCDSWFLNQSMAKRVVVLS